MPSLKSRREHLRRISALPDSQIRIRWDRISTLAIGTGLFAMTMGIFFWMLNLYINL